MVCTPRSIWSLSLLCLLSGATAASAQTPGVCGEAALRAVFQNVIDRSGQLPPATRRVIFKSLRSECGAGFDPTASRFFMGLHYTSARALLDQAANHWGAIRGQLSLDAIFPTYGRPPAGFESKSPDPVVDLRARVALVSGSPAHAALDRLAKSVLKKAAPSLLKPAVDLQRFARFSGDLTPHNLAPFLTPAASRALISLSVPDRAKVIGALQVAAADRVPLTAPNIPTDVAVQQVRGLVGTVQQFDSRMEAASRNMASASACSA
jgi:hypothetical protein